MSAVRDALESECDSCGLPIALANEVVPVLHGKAVDGRWYCGDCIDRIEDAEE